MKYASMLLLILNISSPAAAQQQMVATWYGLNDGSGSHTADGTKFSAHNPHIVAHKTLPFGTRLKITNPRTGRVLSAVVRDRGPNVRGRQLDLTYAGARLLGMGGLATLVVEILH